MFHVGTLISVRVDSLILFPLLWKKQFTYKVIRQNQEVDAVRTPAAFSNSSSIPLSTGRRQHLPIRADHRGKDGIHPLCLLEIGQRDGTGGEWTLFDFRTISYLWSMRDRDKRRDLKYSPPVSEEMQ